MPVVMAICLQHSSLRSRRELKTLRQVLSEAEQRANVLIKNSKSAVAYIDEGYSYTLLMSPISSYSAFKSMNEAVGVPIIDLISGGDSVQGFKQFLRQFDKGSRQDVEFNFESVRTDGSTFEAKATIGIGHVRGRASHSDYYSAEQ